MKSNSRNNFLILISILLLSLNLTINSAIVQDVYSRGSHKAPQVDIRTPKTSKSVLRGFEKFALVTTGNEIKLYPLLADNQASEKSYLIRMFDEQLYQQNFQQGGIAKIHNNYTVSLRSDSILPTRSNGVRKKLASSSIIPIENLPTDDGRFMPSSGTDSYIADINYFFDLRYCAKSPTPTKSDNECMVIIYLDSNRQSLGYAAVDLRLVSYGPGDRRTLWARQIDSVDLHPDGGNYTLRFPDTEIAFDRVHRVIYANLYGSSETDILNEAVILKLDIPGQNAEMRVDRVTSCGTRRDLKNLNLIINNDSNGDWLFYSYKTLNPDPQGISTMQAVSGAVDVSDVPTARNPLRQHGIIVKNGSVDFKHFGVSNSAPDPVTRRIYWLTERNELKSSNFFGEDIQTIDHLPAKHLIKSPGRTEIVQNAFFFSDSRKSLFYQQLSTNSQPSREVKLLLTEDNLVNYRIGHTNYECMNIKSLQTWASLEGDKPIEPTNCLPSLQSLAKNLAASAIGITDPDYHLLKTKVRMECGLDTIGIDLILVLVILLIFIIGFIRCIATVRSESKLLDEKLLSKDKYPV